MPNSCRCWISFAARLLGWYRRQRRDLPWRSTRDPYRILVSEFMLQQTRASTVIPYYRRFLERFPDVHALARAAAPEVLAAWSGLGYYSRAKNLQEAARRVAAAGRFPRTYEAIHELPGAGPYTAAAVASIAFGAAHAAVDGNVIRVMARMTNDPGNIASAAARRRLAEQAQALLDRRHPGAFNQAMMELGATVCLPRAPQCPRCPVSSCCQARAAGTERQLPVKLRAGEPRKIEATLAVILRRGRILLWQRGANVSRMAGFWELPALDQIPGARVRERLGTFRHAITNFRFTVTVVSATAPRAPGELSWHPLERLEQMPVSTITRKALRFTPANRA